MIHESKLATYMHRLNLALIIPATAYAGIGLFLVLAALGEGEPLGVVALLSLLSIYGGGCGLWVFYLRVRRGELEARDRVKGWLASVVFNVAPPATVLILHAPEAPDLRILAALGLFAGPIGVSLLGLRAALDARGELFNVNLDCDLEKRGRLGRLS